MKRRVVSWFVVVSLIYNPGMPCFANPTGGSVVGGDRNGTISGSGTGVTTINQHGNRIIINWQDFSIGPGEITRFIQPSASSWALNRIISGNPSLIYGSLQANGHVLVLNPNGILVGPQGRIDTKGFYASTLDLKDSAFMKGGALTLSGNSTASVRNEGTINALGGDVFLIANTVENSGTISAPQGTVGLAAGSAVRLVPAGNERISVLAGNPNGAAANGVHNVGTVEAATAELKAAGGNIYALAINNEGVIRANSVVNEGGHVYLRASGGNIENSGTISAHNADGSGGTVIMDGGHYTDLPSTVVNSGTIEARGDAAGTKGGKVVMTGDHVGLFDHAVVDVSGDSGGGTALIGGDTHGGNPNVQNAGRTYVDADAIVRADALSLGNGGKVVLWSDEETGFYGNISARGGALGGGGGFAEVSGGTLLYRGGTDLLASRGATGTLLLDPHTITIQTGGAGTIPVSGNVFFTDTPAVDVTFDPGTIAGALSTANVLLQANTDILINNNISAGSATFNLTLNAGRSIMFANNVQVNLGGSFTATINDQNAIPANRDAGVATFTMNSGSSISALGGIDISAGTFGGASVNANLGDMVLTSLSTRANDAANGVNGHNISVVDHAAGSSGQNITLSGTIDAGGSSTTATSGSHPGGDSGTVKLDASGNLTTGTIIATGGAGRGNTGGGGIGNTVSLNAGGSVTANGSIDASGGAAGSGNGNGGAAGDVGITAGTGIALNNNITANGGSKGTTGGSAGAGGTITLDATAGGATQSGGSSLVGADLLLLGAGTFNLNQAGNNVDTLAGNVTGSVTYRDADQLAIGTVGTTHGLASGNNAISITTVNGDLTVNGTTATHDIDAGTSTISLTAQSDSSSGNQDNAIVISSGANIQGTGGVSLTADQMTLTGTIGGGSSTVALNPFEGQTLIKLTGTVKPADVANTLTLSSTELNHVTAGILRIGNANSGNMSIVGTIAPTSSGTLSLQSGGSINQTAGTIGTVGTPVANLALQAGTTITANQANHVGTLAASAGGAIQYTDADDLTIGSVDGVNGVSANNNSIAIATVAGNLTVNDTAAVNDVNAGSGVNSTVSLNAGGPNNVVTISSGANVNGNAGVTLIADDMNLSGTVSTLGTALLLPDTGGGARQITLGTPGVGTLNLSASEINNITAGTLKIGDQNSGAITINDAIHPANALNLSLESGGAITEVSGGSLIVNGLTTLKSSGVGLLGNITLDNTGNDFSTVTVAGGTDVKIRDDNGLIFGGATVSGNLTVTAGGDISETGALIVNGAGKTASFTITGAGDVHLDTQANNFSAVAFSGGINNLALRNDTGTAATAGNLTLPGTVNDLTLIYNNAGITLPGVTVNGNLNVTAGGDIAESGALIVNGATKTATFNANGNDIKLDTQANDFTTVLASGGTVKINDINGIGLGTSSAGALTVTAGGDITESGVLTVSGLASFSAGGNNILLDTFANHFATVSASGNNVRLMDADGIILGASAISGDLNVTANGDITQSGALTFTTAGKTATFAAGTHNIFLDSQPNDFATVAITSGGNVRLNDVNGIDLGGASISGDLTVTAHGLISESGALLVNGAGKTATFNANGNDIKLDTQANDFTTVLASGNNVAFNDINDIDLGASTAGSTLTVTAHGNISQSGALNVVSGASSFFVDTFAGGNVSLGNPGNHFANQTVTINGVNGGTVGNVDFRNVDPNAVFPTVPANFANLTVQFDTAPITITTPFTLSGDLTLTAGGAGGFITQNAGTPIVVNGSTTLTAASGNDINLFDANNFVGSVSIVSGQNVTLNDINGIDLGASTVSGALKVTAAGNITDSGDVKVTGTTTLAAGPGDITLDNNDNFGGTVGIVSGQNVTLNAINGIDLGASTVSGALKVTAAGNITDSGDVRVTGTTTLSAGSGNDITLDNNDDFVGTVSIVSGHDVTLNDINAIDLGASTVGGALKVTAAGNITDSGDVKVTGTTTLAAGPGDITLDNNDNFGGTVSIVSGQNVTLNAISGIDLGASTVSGALKVTAAGNITDSGDVKVTGATTLAAGSGNDITLNNNDDFGGTVSVVSGRNVTLNDINAIDLGASTVSGTLKVTAAGNITDSGDVKVTGATTLTAGSGNDITLDNNDDFGGAVSIVSGNNVTLNDINGIDLGASTVSGALAVTAGGNITQSGSLSVTHDATFKAAGGNDIILDESGNTFNGAVTFGSTGGGSLRDVTVVDTTAFDINPITVSGTFAVSSGGPVTQSGAINAANLEVISSGNVTLNNNGNTVTTLAIDANGTVQFTETAGTKLTIGKVDGAGTVPEVSGIDSHGNNITLTADDFDIAQKIDATKGGGDVVLQPASHGRNIHFGPTENPGAMNFTQGELNLISGRQLTIGDLFAGDVTGGHSQPPGVSVDPINILSAGARNDFDVVANQLSSLLAGAILPVPKLEVTSFSGAAIDASEAAKILPPGSIGTLFLQVPFIPVEARKYKVEEVSKWTTGRISASGTTAGPQTPR